MARGRFRRTLIDYLERKITLQAQRLQVELEFMKSLKKQLEEAIIEDASETEQDNRVTQETKGSYSVERRFKTDI